MALGDEGHHGAGYLCHERQRRHWRIDNDISHLRRYLISHTASLVTVARGFAFGRMPRENKSLSCRRQAVAFVRSFVHSFKTISRAHYVENVDSEALEAVARWSVIGH